MLDPKLNAYFNANTPLFEQVMQLRGEVFREREGRRTQRIRLGDHSYFLKQHSGVGWKEILKNLIQGRLPVVSAKNEYVAIRHLEKIGVPTMKVVAYDSRGCNPARIQSYLMTDDLIQTQSLEDYCRDWQRVPPPVLEKRALLKEVARLARLMHASGMNHRDFYICHFLLQMSTAQSTQPVLYLIDLHRAQIRTTLPERWQLKDLVGLYFSSHDLGLSSRDFLRFIAEYTQKKWRDLNSKEKHFWQKVKQRGNEMYRQHGQ